MCPFTSGCGVNFGFALTASFFLLLLKNLTKLSVGSIDNGIQTFI